MTNSEQVDYYKHKIEENLGLLDLPRGVSLMLVTKGHPVEALLAAQDFDIPTLGENRFQELRDKVPFLNDTIKEKLAFIGSLQTNKLNSVLEICGRVVVDRDGLMDALIKKTPVRRIAVDLQVNFTGEPQKKGYANETDAEEALKLLVATGKYILNGVMAMGPHTPDKRRIKNTFIRVRDFYENLKKKFPVKTLSMGMSDDYLIAMDCGANEVRLGTRVLGPRGGSPSS